MSRYYTPNKVETTNVENESRRQRKKSGTISNSMYMSFYSNIGTN